MAPSPIIANCDGYLSTLTSRALIILPPPLKFGRPNQHSLATCLITRCCSLAMGGWTHHPASPVNKDRRRHSSRSLISCSWRLNVNDYTSRIFNLKSSAQFRQRCKRSNRSTRKIITTGQHIGYGLMRLHTIFCILTTCYYTPTEMHNQSLFISQTHTHTHTEQ